MTPARPRKWCLLAHWKVPIRKIYGKLTTLEPAAGRIGKNFGPGESEGSASIAASATLASGYAAIWARENTRESLFDALIRRETYATTGPRITVRFFGDWNFEEGDEQRRIRRNKVDPVGNTVNVEQASYRNSIGDPALAVVWEDPNFDPDIKAFYYARVLEIPTPNWATIDAAYYGDKLPGDVAAYQQERAYTSLIWYSPKSK